MAGPERRSPDASDPPEMGLGARLVGVIVSPRATMERVARAPRWLGVLAVSLACVGAISTTLLSTEVGRRALLTQQIEGMAALGMTVTDEQYDRMEDAGRYAVYAQLAALAVGVPVLCAGLAGILHVWGYGVLGATASYVQVLAVVAHAGVVFVVQQLFVAPLNYARESLSNPATLAAFVPMLDRDTVMVRLLSVVDLFFVWWLMILAMGLAVVWQRRTLPIAASLYALYAGLAVIAAVVITRVGA